MKQIHPIVKRIFHGVDRDHAAIVLLLVFCAALFLPAIFLGIPENYDLGQHMRFARTWHDAIANGVYIPSWGASDNAGLGSAGIRFYPPLTHFVMAAVQFVTGSWYDTIWMTMLFWMWIGSVGVFKLASEWSSRKVALGSAVLYIIVPYHLLQVFQAFLLAEFAAAAILPFCFLYAHRLVTKGGTANILLFFLAYSALILTHIPTTIIGTVTLAVFVVGFLSIESLRRSIVRFAIAIGITLAATAFYWVRLVSELSWIKHNTPEYYAAGGYNYSTYLFPMLYSSGESYVGKFLWLFDICILVTYALLIPAVIVLIKKKLDVPRYLISLLSVAALALFMMSILSSPVWNNIEFVQKLQFPYRWLAAASLAAALLFPIGVAALAEGRSVISRSFAYSLASIIMVLTVLDVSQIIVPSAPVPREEIAKTVQKLDSKPACECWWPVWATRDVMKDTRQVVAGDRDFTISKWNSLERSFVVNAGSAERVRVGTFFYPHWKATVNSLPAEVSADPNGLIEIPIPADIAEVNLEFREPSIVIWSRYVSAATIAGILALLLFTAFRSRMS